LTPPFVPYPPDSLRQAESSSSKDEDEDEDDKGPDPLHYSKVWVSALRLGYSRRELAVMPYGEVIFDLAAMNDATPIKKEQEADVVVSKATQQDIRTMLG